MKCHTCGTDNSKTECLHYEKQREKSVWEFTKVREGIDNYIAIQKDPAYQSADIIQKILIKSYAITHHGFGDRRFDTSTIAKELRTQYY